MWVDKYRTLIISAVFKIVFAKVVITLFFIFIFVQKRIYMRFLLIYTCLHLIISKTVLSVYVNNRDLLCKNKESSASEKKPDHAKIANKKKICSRESLTLRKTVTLATLPLQYKSSSLQATSTTK